MRGNRFEIEQVFLIDILLEVFKLKLCIVLYIQSAGLLGLLDQLSAKYSVDNDSPIFGDLFYGLDYDITDLYQQSVMIL